MIFYLTFDNIDDTALHMIAQRRLGKITITKMPELKERPKIRRQTLEYIAKHFGERCYGTQIVDLLKSWGVPDMLIEYPNTKWRMVFSVLCHYADSEEKADKEMLRKIIGEVLHPVMYGGNKAASEAACKNFNKYLEYDNLVAGYDPKEKRYYVGRLVPDAEQEELVLIDEITKEMKLAKAECEFLQEPKNKERISTLRKAYQILINIVEAFCENPSKPTPEMNDAYIKTKKLITDNHLPSFVYRDDRVFRIFGDCPYFIPFKNLFGAEAEYKERILERLHWDDIRPKMHASYGAIDELYRKAEGSDVLSQPDVQQILNDVSLFLSKTKEENKKRTEVKQKAVASQAPVQEIKITSMPPLVVGNAGDSKKIDFYITKKSDDFYYKGRYLNLSKRSHYYKVFSALYAKLPEGGEISYNDLIVEVKSRFLYRMQNDTDEEMRKFIQRNLTDKSNGLMRYAGIPATEDNGKPLIEVVRGSGIIFNNKTG